VGQPRPKMPPLVVQEHLRLVLQPAERRGMDDAVAVTLEFRPRWRGIDRMKPAAALRRIGCVGRKFAHRGKTGLSFLRPASYLCPIDCNGRNGMKPWPKQH